MLTTDKPHRRGMTETEADRLVRIFKPQFISWTDWILDGDAVTYGHNWPSACRWIIPGTGEQRFRGERT